MRRFVLFLLSFVFFALSIARGNEPYRGYRGNVELAFGDAYNLNTAQTISTNNMQLYSEITTTHGFVMNNWFVGAGAGYYHSFRDGENMFPMYAAGRYTFGKVKVKPYIEARAGIAYDPLWVETTQMYGVLSAGTSVYKKLQVGLRGTMFSRPSRYFTANVAFSLSYEFGK